MTKIIIQNTAIWVLKRFCIDEEIVPELIQANSKKLFSAEEKSENKVEYISETENKKLQPDTISKTEKLKQCSLTQF